MRSLYEAISNLDKFTNDLKEEKVIKKQSPNVEYLVLLYGNGEIEVELSDIKTFNFCIVSDEEDIGYICLDIGELSLDDFSLDYLCNENDIKEVKVYLNDETKEIYNIEWCSTFERIEDNMYLIVFKGKKEILQD